MCAHIHLSVYSPHLIRQSQDTMNTVNGCCSLHGSLVALSHINDMTRILHSNGHPCVIDSGSHSDATEDLCAKVTGTQQ